jgi:hypothetical protein
VCEDQRLTLWDLLSPMLHTLWDLLSPVLHTLWDLLSPVLHTLPCCSSAASSPLFSGLGRWLNR